MSSTNTFDTIVIGAGISGLISACILAKQGQHVALVEKNAIPGGMLQSFTRNQQRFDSSVHYIGAMAPGQTLWTYFRYLDIHDRLSLQELAPTGFDVYQFPTFSFRVPRGVEAYRQALLRACPQETDAIDAFIQRMQDVCKRIPLYNPHEQRQGARDYIQEESLGQYLDQLGASAELRGIICAPTYLYNVHPSQCPLHLHFLVLHSFLQSAWRIEGGSQQLADLLATRFKELGGTLLLRHHVQSIDVEKRHATQVHFKEHPPCKATSILCALHPAAMMKLLPPKALRSSYKERTLTRKNGLGAFSFFLKLPPTYDLDHNIYFFDDVDVTRGYSPRLHRAPEIERPSMFFLACDRGSLQGFTTMSYDTAVAWCGGQEYGRSPQYHRTKKQTEEQLKTHLQDLLTTWPIQDAPIWSATPLTYERYTATQQGTSYGYQHDMESLSNPVMPKTPIKNLFLTGQSVLLPGVVGATLSAVLTCCQMIGWSTLLEDITRDVW